MRASSAVSVAEIDSLRRAGLISGRRYLDAVYLCRDPELWRRFGLRTLLALGVGHVLAGVIFFFAYNWDDLAPAAKFALVEGAIVVSVAAALLSGLRGAGGAGGASLLITASVLVGVLLALVGQVYQTNADAFDLFTAWGVLIVPWVAVSRNAVHWLVWLVVVFAAASLYGIQVLIPLQIVSGAELTSLLALLAAAVVAARELAVRHGYDWLDAQWTRIVPVFAALAIVFPAAILFIVDEGPEPGVVALAVFLSILAAGALLYLKFLPDFAAAAIGTGFLALLLMAVGWRVLDETLGFDWQDASSILPSLGLLVLWCAGLTAASLKWLAALRARPDHAHA